MNTQTVYNGFISAPFTFVFFLFVYINTRMCVYCVFFLLFQFSFFQKFFIQTSCEQPDAYIYFALRYVEDTISTANKILILHLASLSPTRPPVFWHFFSMNSMQTWNANCRKRESFYLFQSIPDVEFKIEKRTNAEPAGEKKKNEWFANNNVIWSTFIILMFSLLFADFRFSQFQFWNFRLLLLLLLLCVFCWISSSYCCKLNWVVYFVEST